MFGALRLDALSNWTAIEAIGTLLLVLATSFLAGVGLYAAQWAKRTFGQQEQEAKSKREPYIAIWLHAPTAWTAGNYNWWTESQFDVFFRWYALISGRPAMKAASLAEMTWRIVCSVQNLGEGIAVRIVVPYKLTVWDIAADKEPSGSQSYDGTFEVFHVPGGTTISSLKHLDVTYYPKWKVELFLTSAEVTGVQGVKFDNEDIITETSVLGATLEQNNDQRWDTLLRIQPDQESSTTDGQQA